MSLEHVLPQSCTQPFLWRSLVPVGSKCCLESYSGHWGCSFLQGCSLFLDVFSGQSSEFLKLYHEFMLKPEIQIQNYRVLIFHMPSSFPFSFGLILELTTLSWKSAHALLPITYPCPNCYSQGPLLILGLLLFIFYRPLWPTAISTFTVGIHNAHLTVMWHCKIYWGLKIEV